MARLASLLAVAASMAAAAAAAPVQLAAGVHTILDGALIASTSPGVALELGRPAKDPYPLIQRTQPWEGALGFYTSMLQVPAELSGTGAPQLRAYYTCGDGVLFFVPIGLCVATSDDAGRTWRKPLFNYYPYTANGTLPPTPTNIVFYDGANTFGGNVAIDPFAPAAERFKLSFEATGARYVYLATSPDGFAFRGYNASVNAGPAIQVNGFGDTQPHIQYDAPSNRWLAFGRYDMGLPGDTTMWCNGSYAVRNGRMAALQCGAAGEACDPGNASAWGQWYPTYRMGAPDDQQCLDLYDPAPIALGPDAAFGGQTNWVSLPSSFRHIPAAQSGLLNISGRAAGNDGFMDVVLYSSRNAVNWTRPAGYDAFLPRGVGARDPASGCYNVTGSDLDAGFIFATSAGLIDPDDFKNASAAARPVGGVYRVRASAVAPDGSARGAGLQLRAAAEALPVPSPWLALLYWGGQALHGGGGSFFYQQLQAFAGIFKAHLRREGFTALATPPQDPTGLGWAATVPLLLPSPPPDAPGAALVLRVNAEIAAGGNMTIAIQDAATGAPLPGYGPDDCLQLRGNGVRQLAVWGASRATWVGGSPALPSVATPIVFNFTMAHARLHAWELAWVAQQLD